MKIEGPAKLLRVYIGESDQWRGQPLYSAIVFRARQEGLAGATVLHGLEGFGANSRIHTSRILRLSEDQTRVVEIVDSEEKINAFLPILDEMVTEGLVVVLDVKVMRYVSNKTPAPTHP